MFTTISSGTRESQLRTLQSTQVVQSIVEVFLVSTFTTTRSSSSINNRRREQLEHLSCRLVRRRRDFPDSPFSNGRPWSDAGSCDRGCDVGITPTDRRRSTSGTQRVAAGLLHLQEEAEEGAWRCARKCVLHHFLWGALRAVWRALCAGKPD